MSAVSHSGNKSTYSSEHRSSIFVLFRNIAAQEYACDTLQARELLDNSKELARLRAHEFGRFGE